MKPVLIVLKDTTLKLSPVVSTKLGDGEKQEVKKGFTLPLAAYKIEGSHIKFTIWQRANDIKGKNTWYAFSDHVQVSFDGQVLQGPKPVVNPNSKSAIRLFDGSLIDLNQSVIPNGALTWRELTHDGERLPPDNLILRNMISIAKAAQKARDVIKLPIIVTSGYRPPDINRRVGGASNSQHLYGNAIDIWVDGYTGIELARRLSWWPGGLGIYSNMPELLHLDARDYQARWGPGF